MIENIFPLKVTVLFVVSQNNYQHDRNAIDKCFPIRGNKNLLLFQIVQRYFWIKFNSRYVY